MQVIEQLIKEKFSLIPLAINSKLPVAGLRWKPHQYRRASIEEVFDWYTKFGDINIGVICGRISKLVVIDVDNERQLLELLKVIPDLFNTCYVKTKRGYHFYFFTNDDIRSTSRLFGLDGIELKSKGRYVVSAGSVVSGFKYKYVKSLTHTKPIPKVISGEYKGVITGDITKDIEIPRCKAKCISQILNYDLPYHRRKLAYHIAYCKMRQEGHKKDYAIYVCKEANKKLSLPLTKKSDFDFGEVYPFGCLRINEELSFIDCSGCQIRGGLKVQSLAMRSFHKLKGLTNSQRGILLTLDTYFKGLVGEELPTIYEIQKYSDTYIDYYTVRNALEVLKEKGIIK